MLSCRFLLILLMSSLFPNLPSARNAALLRRADKKLNSYFFFRGRHFFIDDANKLHEISENIVVGLNGGVGESTQFVQYLAKNLQLYKTRNRYSLDTVAVAHFARGTMIEALHKGTPSMLNVLIAGYDEASGAELYTMDFLGSSMQVPYASHGIGGYLGLGILQHYYKPTLTEKEVYEILKLCVHEIHRRLFINLANFQVKTVSKEGVRHLPSICPESLFLQ